MNIVMDSNVLFSALISETATRNLILEYNGLFLMPEFVLEEIDEHIEELLEKSGMDRKDFMELLRFVLKKVLVVPNKVLFPYKEKALEIVKNIDIDDVLFFACALAQPNSVIWSDDKKLKSQMFVVILNTTEIARILMDDL